ncbi:hypothetical protein L1987_74210 [Smallanthus sonchifolius]|uniref:Uncharacterized protein n=1 Tax=Smallanthus sonchifolius TaxID=185202 RepID=A0ACB9A2B3_9ASTR|nr:hypothetical protein L1987_74210 [Smallanthus sonchifolius]
MKMSSNRNVHVLHSGSLQTAGSSSNIKIVEDMDIAVRAHLHGWKMIFLNDVELIISCGVDVNSQSQFGSWHLSDLVVGHGKQDALRLLLKQR